MDGEKKVNSKYKNKAKKKLDIFKIFGFSLIIALVVAVITIIIGGIEFNNTYKTGELFVTVGWPLIWLQISGDSSDFLNFLYILVDIVVYMIITFVLLLCYSIYKNKK